VTASALTSALLRATGAIEGLGLRYAVVGGLAVGAWTPPRATRDADLWVGIGGAGDALRQALVDAGFHVPAMQEELDRFGVFRSKARDSGVFVDIFDATGPLGEAILTHRQRCEVADVSLWYARPEELAALKAFSDRPRDFEDLVALVTHADLDTAVVESWARQLDASIGTDEVSTRLTKAMAQAARAGERSGRQ
jgi:hypothetical protein